LGDTACRTLRGWYDIDRREKERKGLPVPVVITGIKEPNIQNPDSSEVGGPDGGGDGDTLAQAFNSTMEEDGDCAGDSSRKTKQRRQRYSNETKIQVILALESRPDASLNDVAKEFGVAPGTVRGWREEADKIQKQATENRRSGAKANPSRDPLKRIWDSILRLFELNSRLPTDQRLDVNVAVVRAIGKQARDDLLAANERSGHTLLSETEKSSMEKFKSSETWARKWARDHEVISSKPERNPFDAAQNRMAELQQLVASFPPDNVYTMTSTGLFYRILPQRTFVTTLSGHNAAMAGDTNHQSPTITRARACKGLKSKDRLTLYLCANESGRDKLPIAVIGKYANPACFQVKAQRKLPYFHQKQALSDAGTFQRWWRSVFLPHVRERHPVVATVDNESGASFTDAMKDDPMNATAMPVGGVGKVTDSSHPTNGNKILLLVEATGPCKAELLRDPTGQVHVEAFSPSLGSFLNISDGKDGISVAGVSGDINPFSPAVNRLHQYHPFDFEIIETIKRRYRYRLLQEMLVSFAEREDRRAVANKANYNEASRGLREGSVLHVGDAMRLLTTTWDEVAATSIARSWQRTKMRGTNNNPNVAPKEQQETKTGQRAKSEKRQTTREKKKLMKDLTSFFSQNLDVTAHQFSFRQRLEGDVASLKQSLTNDTGTLIDSRNIDNLLEDWVKLESNSDFQNLIMEEIREEMNIDYLTGLKRPVESVIPEADEPEEPEMETRKSEKNQKEVKLDQEKALELAATIKKTAVKLFESGDVLGDLAVTLDEASDKIFSLLRKEKEANDTKESAIKEKSNRTASVSGPAETTTDGIDMTEQGGGDVAPPAQASAHDTADDNDIAGIFDSELPSFQQV
jgi:transposase-like protein